MTKPNAHSRFNCTVNEVVLKALPKDDELNHDCAMEIAIETKDAAMVVKDPVHGMASLLAR